MLESAAKEKISEASHTVLNQIQCIKKISILKNARFSGKGCQSLHIKVMRIRKKLIS